MVGAGFKKLLTQIAAHGESHASRAATLIITTLRIKTVGITDVTLHNIVLISVNAQSHYAGIH